MIDHNPLGSFTEYVLQLRRFVGLWRINTGFKVITLATGAMVNIYELLWQSSRLVPSPYLRAFMILSQVITLPKAYSMFFNVKV